MFANLRLFIQRVRAILSRAVPPPQIAFAGLVLIGAIFANVAMAAPFTLICNITSYKHLGYKGEMKSTSLLDLEPSTRTGSIKIDLDNETCDGRRCNISDTEIMQTRKYPDGTMESVISRVTGQMVKSFYLNDGTLKREQIYTCSKREAAF